ncbi:MAG: hypothetical protein ABI743_11980, partial [bacterium]
PSGTWMVYTANREGDLNVWVRNLESGKEMQVTHKLGYDGGAVFSPNAAQIVWRASYPITDEEKADYSALLDQDLIRPTHLNLYMADRNGEHVRQLTTVDAADFCPVFLPDSQHLMFSSNRLDPQKREFDLFILNLKNGTTKRVTAAPGFDGFPMPSYSGRLMAFCSNRNPSHEGNTNVFVAEWIDPDINE